MIHCGEECNMDCTGLFEGMISQILERDQARIVLDLSEVNYMDSKFLGSLAGMLKKTREAGGDLQIAAAQDHICTLFRTIRYDSLFCLYPTIEDAALSFEPKSDSSKDS